MKVFLTCEDEDVQLKRKSIILIMWVNRDVTERGRNLRGVIESFNKYAKNAYETFIKPVKIKDFYFDYL